MLKSLLNGARRLAPSGSKRRSVLITAIGGLLFLGVLIVGGVGLMAAAYYFFAPNHWEDDRRAADYNRPGPVIREKPFNWVRGGDEVILSFDRTLYRVSLDGTVLERISPDRKKDASSYAGSPNPDPDGRLYYALSTDWEEEPYHWSIVSTDLQGKDLQRLSRPEYGYYHAGPHLSPDGSHIMYYEGSYGSGSRPALMKADGTGQIHPEWPDGTYILGGWSPDSKALLMWGRNNESNQPESTSSHGDIYVSRIEDLQPQLVARGAMSVPSWSPDGTRIAFTRVLDIPEKTILYTVKPDGSELQPVAVMPDTFRNNWRTVGHRLAWSPDSSSILISGYASHIALVDTASASVRLWEYPLVRLPDGQAMEQGAFYADWSPDGGAILAYHHIPAKLAEEWLPAQEAILFTLSSDLSNYRVLVRHSEDSVGEGALSKKRYWKTPVLGEGKGFPGGEPSYEYHELNLAGLNPEPAETDQTTDMVQDPGVVRDNPSSLGHPTAASRIGDSTGGQDSAASPGASNSNRAPVPPEADAEVKTKDVSGQEITPPCSGEDTGICSSRGVSETPFFDAGAGAAGVPVEFPSTEELLDRGWHGLNRSPTHIAIRGTIAEGSIRCHGPGRAQTLAQREETLRFWLNIADGDPLPGLETMREKLSVERAGVPIRFQEYAYSGIEAAMIGGLFADRARIVCYAELATADYLVGEGPQQITVGYHLLDEIYSHELYTRISDDRVNPSTPRMSRGEFESFVRAKLHGYETAISEFLAGREAVIFLAPMGLHDTIAVEAWQAVAQWDLQTNTFEDDMGNQMSATFAVRYDVPDGHPESRQQYSEFETRIEDHLSDSELSRIANISGLEAYYREIGAYGDITPDDGSTATFTPAQPPAPYACAGATVIADPSTKQSLVHDCEALLEAKDTLRGTATLNWATTLPLGSWDGVTAMGTPPRVTGLDLSGEGLSGTIPGSLGSLFELTELDLSSNSLTGSIPEEMGWLHNLTTLRLSGNNLTGCIPLALKGVATNDLSSLNLLYCQPETPAGLTAGTAGEFSVPLSWTAVDNAAMYEVQHRPGRVGDWTSYATEPTGVSQRVDGLECATEYQFRVRAFGSGTTHAADWSNTSIPVVAATTECVSPVFGEAVYQWEAYDDGASGEELGTASATDPNGDSLTYSITDGNDDGQFSIDTGTGQVTLAGDVDGTVGDTFTLTVTATDGTNTGTVAVTVTIAASPACGMGLAAPSASSDPALVNDCEALLEARETLEGSQHIDWSTRRPLAQWQGVTLSGTPQRVTGLDLSGSSLDGTVPTTLGRLTALETLDLGDNALTGTIPTELGSLTGLEMLDLGSNELSGAIPTELGGLADLTGLLLDGNGLTGAIPAELGAITGLQELDLGGNMLTGAMPEQLASLTNLTGLDLGGNQLTGSLPVWLGGLADLESLDLGGNGLTGFIPAELEMLDNLASLALSGNPLAGCIPSGLEDITTHDLSMLNLDYCSAGVDAAPLGLTVSLAQDAFSISWTALAGSAGYDAQHRTTAQDSEWESLPEATTAEAAYSPAGGAACGTTYRFRVRAHGDGVSRAYGWTPYSGAEELTTVRCNQAPSFTMGSFGFSVAENSAAGTVVGTPLATDLDQDLVVDETLTYSITLGNDESLFAIDDTSGEISVAGDLDYEDTSSHTLTVQVDDSLGARATVQVTISVTNVPEGTVPAPTDASVSLVAGVFTISWTGSNLAARYQAEYRIEGDAAGWTPLPETTAASATYTPEQAPGCGLVYQFQVRAYGDGVTVIADWSGYSLLVSVATEACNQDPSFDEASYSFTLAETAALGVSIGSVSATDEDTGDNLEFSITEGNEGNAFSVNLETGSITVAGPLNYLTLPSYTLTLSVSDGRGGEDSVTVTVTLDSACSNGVVANPGSNPGLVADCVILYGSRGLLAGTGSLDWSAATAMNSWEGVRIEGTPRRVTILRLDDKGLTGVIPPALGGLSALTRIDLDLNSLTGEIPGELGNLSDLTHLYLHDNQLTGEIPTELGNLERLQVLYLADNSLTGVIPAELGNLSSLVSLDLNGNSLTGPLPASLGNLSRLEHLIVNDNQLSGNFPSELGNLWNLEILNLAVNSFPGRLPPSFGRLRPTTVYLRGVNNSIHGCMPHGWRDVAVHHDLNDAENFSLPECRNQAPAFAEESYSFTVSESAAMGASVGTVSATDADGRTVTYSVTAGDDDGRFSVSGTGEITLAAVLDFEITESYSLTLQALDDDDATTTVTVAVAVEDVDGS